MPGFRKKSRRNRSNRRNVKKRQSRRNRTNGGRRYRHRGGMEQGAPGGTDATTTETTFTPKVLQATTTISMKNSKTGTETIYETITNKNGEIQISSKEGGTEVEKEGGEEEEVKEDQTRQDE